MARQRLGVVLLVPQPLATEIDGVRRALGDGALPRIAPHITLVPPVNVVERDLPEALSIVRRAAGATAPLHLTLGPVVTFAPVNPVAYLQVGGDEEQLAAVHALRGSCLAGPLERRSEHAFVPHVTVADDLSAERLKAAVAALAPFRAELLVESVHVLAEQPGRIWRPVADAPLGDPAAVLGRGSLPLELSVSGRPDPEAAALLAVESDAPGLPFAVTARRDRVVVGAAWGWSAAARLEVAELLVAAGHRNQGVGRHLLASVEALAARRECSVAGLAAPTTGAAAALLAGAGWAVVGDASGDGDGDGGSRRWERRLRARDSGS